MDAFVKKAIEKAPDLEKYLHDLNGFSDKDNYGILIKGVGPEEVKREIDHQFAEHVMYCWDLSTKKKKVLLNIGGFNDRLYHATGFDHDTAIRMGSADFTPDPLLKAVKWFGDYILMNDYKALGFIIGGRCYIRWKRL